MLYVVHSHIAGAKVTVHTPKGSCSIVVIFGVCPCIACHEAFEIDGVWRVLAVPLQHGTSQPGNIVAPIGLQFGRGIQCIYTEHMSITTTLLNIGTTSTCTMTAA